jgi:hypothetical protein
MLSAALVFFLGAMAFRVVRCVLWIVSVVMSNLDRMWDLRARASYCQVFMPQAHIIGTSPRSLSLPLAPLDSGHQPTEDDPVRTVLLDWAQIPCSMISRT